MPHATDRLSREVGARRVLRRPLVVVAHVAGGEWGRQCLINLVAQRVSSRTSDFGLNPPGFPGVSSSVPSGLLRLTLVTIVRLELTRRGVTEFAVETPVVEPRHAGAGRDFEVVEFLPVATVAGPYGQVALQFGLEEASGVARALMALYDTSRSRGL